MSLNVTLAGQLLFPSEYIGAVDLRGRDVVVTIAKVELADLRMVGGKSQRKPIVYFTGAQKKLVMNKTNAGTIASLYGGKVEAWVGKKITLYPTRTRCGANTVDCIRVREQVPGTPQQAPMEGDGFPTDTSDAEEAAMNAELDRQ